MADRTIDNPVEASFGAWPEEQGDFARKFTDLALSFESTWLPPAKLLKILRDQFSTSNRLARIEYLLNGFRIGFQKVTSESVADRERLRAIEEKLSSEQFSEAVAAACEEAARATSEKKIQQLAAVLTGSLTPSKWADPNDNLADMIRDVARFGEVDIRILEIMEETFRTVYGLSPDLVTNQFVEHISELTNAMHKAAMHQDDFYGTCLRLSGFGLATEERPTVRSGGERCFRPTRRGLALLGYLRAFRAD